MDPKPLKMMSAIGFVVFLVGIIWLGVNVVSFWGMRIVEGKVVGSVTNQGGSTTLSVVGYEVEGKAFKVNIDSRYGKRGQKLHKTGDPISIAYKPDNPSDAKEFNVALAYAIPGILAFAGLSTGLAMGWLGKQVAAQAKRPPNV